jgi:hypothetical protein
MPALVTNGFVAWTAPLLRFIQWSFSTPANAVHFLSLAIPVILWCLLCVFHRGPQDWYAGKTFESTPPPPEANVQFVLERRLVIYEEWQAKMASNLRYQALLCFFAWCLVYRWSRSRQQQGSSNSDIHISIFNVQISVPKSAVLLVVCVCMFYTWVTFGYVLNNAVHNRIRAWQMILAYDKIAFKLNTLPTQEYFKTNSYSTSYSIRSTLHDGFFLDAWFVQFRPQYHNMSTGGIHLFLIVAVLMLRGIIHGLIAACSLRLFQDLSKAGNKALFQFPFWANFRPRKIVHMFVIVGFAILVNFVIGGLPQWIFAYMGRHPSTQYFMLIEAFTAITTFFVAGFRHLCAPPVQIPESFVVYES